MRIENLGRKLAQKAIMTAVTPPLFIAEVALVGGLLLGFGAMALHSLLETPEEREAEMARRREFIEKVKADRYYR